MRRGGRTIAILGLLAVAIGLAACASPVEAVPSPSVAPTPTPTLQPSAEPAPSADPLAAVAAVVARPEALELRDAEGAVVARLDYLGDAAEAIATVERLMGEPAVAEDYRGTSHFPPTTAHRWGAFELWEQRYVDRWSDFADRPRTLYQPSFSIMFTGATAGDVALLTEQSFAAGDAWEELQAAPGLQVNPSGCSGPYLDFIEREETWPDGTVHLQRFAVDFVENEDAASIGRVRAPMPVQDGCA